LRLDSFTLSFDPRCFDEEPAENRDALSRLRSSGTFFVEDSNESVS
jgi:hypothetical protein